VEERLMVWDVIGKAVVEAARFIPVIIEIINTACASSSAVCDNEALARQSEDIQLAQLKLQYLQHQETLNFQAQQAQLSHEKAKELQAFIQRAEDIRLQKSLDFQRWSLEQEKALQLELCDRNLQLQRELIAYQRQTSLKVVEEQKRLENSPIWLVASDILNSHPNEEKIPLRIFLAPPKLQFERFSGITNTVNHFPDIELTLAEGLRQFLRNYSIAGRPIDFLAGAWTSKSFHSEASIKALFSVLKSEPTLVLESEVDGDYLNFRIAFWNSNSTKYRYEPIISKLSYREILQESAKARAQKWLKTRKTLIATGESPEEVDKLYGGDNVKNLEIWQREKRFQEAGLDLSELEFDYTINKKDFEELCQFILIYHCVFAGLFCDEYFLVQYNLPPLLPQIITQVIKETSHPEITQELLNGVILYYQNLYQTLSNTRSVLLPELILDLSLSLANLSSKEWAKRQAIDSIKAWLTLRDLEQSDDFYELLNIVLSALKLEDKDYVEKLNQCLLAIGEETRLKIDDEYYQRGINDCQKEEYQNAINNFTRAIEINLNLAEAYHSRGSAYVKLRQYSKAIADYTQALQFYNNWEDTYNNRGNAYYKLGEYENAIADYEQAININPNFEVAIKNKAIAEQELREVKRKEEKNPKRRLEKL
jgi:tetratricopeptide (TPR) repeat protein